MAGITDAISLSLRPIAQERGPAQVECLRVTQCTGAQVLHPLHAGG
jgi:hypothetical protein